MVFDKGNRLFVCDWGGLIKMYKKNGKKAMETKVRARGCRYVSFTPDGGKLLYAEGPSDLKIWDVFRKQEFLVQIEGPRIQDRIGVFSPDGTLAASVASRKGGMIWDASNGDGVDTFGGAIKDGSGPIAMSLVFSPDNKKVAVGYAGGRVFVITVD